VTITEKDVAGNTSLVSLPLSVRLDATPPATITAALDPTSDTGTFTNDGVTQFATPTFSGTAEISPYPSAIPSPLTDGTLVQIYVQRVAAQGQPTNPLILAGEALADPGTGRYSVTVGHYVNPQPAGALQGLADGAYNVTAIQYDVAGNFSKP